ALMNAVLAMPRFRAAVAAVIADRPTPALDKARQWGIPAILHADGDAAAFSDFVLAHVEGNGLGGVISSYLKLFRGPILTALRHRMINLHPSLLPAFAGFDAVPRAAAHAVRFVGNTAHFIDESIDGGPIIMQSALPCPPAPDLDALRHRLFVQR